MGGETKKKVDFDCFHGQISPGGITNIHYLQDLNHCDRGNDHVLVADERISQLLLARSVEPKCRRLVAIGRHRAVSQVQETATLQTNFEILDCARVVHIGILPSLIDQIVDLCFFYKRTTKIIQADENTEYVLISCGTCGHARGRPDDKRPLYLVMSNISIDDDYQLEQHQEGQQSAVLDRREMGKSRKKSTKRVHCAQTNDEKNRRTQYRGEHYPVSSKGSSTPQDGDRQDEQAQHYQSPRQSRGLEQDGRTTCQAKDAQTKESDTCELVLLTRQKDKC